MEFNKRRWWYIITVVISISSKSIHSAPHQHSNDDTCHKKAADIVVAIDASFSIHKEDFDKQIQFVERVIDNLPIGKNRIHLGVLTFGTNITEYTNLNEDYNKKDKITVLKKVTHSGGGTNTSGVIKHAREMMFNSPDNVHRGEVDKLMIVITDGISFNMTRTAYEASISRNHGITMVAVGIALYHDDMELQLIANKPTSDIQSFLFKANTFDHLSKLESALEKTLCKAIHSIEGDPSQGDGTDTDHVDKSEIEKHCGGKPADVYFVLDSSSSIDNHNFRKMLNFVTEVVDMFDIGAKATRIGIVSYSYSVHLSIDLNENLPKENLKQRIRRLPYLRGGTQTGSALQYIRERGFSSVVARKSVAHVLIILTDGQSADPKLTIKEADELQKRGVYIFALGIGEQVDKEELYSMASEPKNNFLFEMEDFDALPSIKNVLAIKTCKAGTNTDAAQNDEAMCFPTQSMDVMFAFDEHSLGVKKSSMLFEIIKDVMSTVNSIQVRTGIMTHSCEGLRNIPLSSYRNVQQLETSVTTTQSQGLPALLRKLRLKGYRQEEGGRDSAKNVAFVFIDGSLVRPKNTILELKRLRYGSRTEVYVVAIGDTDYHTIEQMVSNPVKEHILSVTDYSDLLNMRMQLLEKLCV